MLYTCTICNKTNKETLEKLSTHSFDAGKVSKEPTCGAEGEKTYTCTVCKQTKKERIEKLSDHSFGKGTVTKSPTCKEPGEKTYTCSTCGETQSVVIEKTDQHMPGPPATATDAQLCLNCGTILAPANGDPASTVVTTTAPPYSAQPTTSPQISPSGPHGTDEDPQGTATTHGQTNPVPTEPENTGYPVTLPGEGMVNATPVAAMIFGMCFILMFGIFGVVLLIKRDK
jgi:DNA-directed RNA polymerase subunit RPC12/RpoP